MTPPVRRLAAAGHLFAYREAGEGPVALLLHGFGMDSRMWDDVVSRIASHRRCVALDLRGAGGTSLGIDDVFPVERHADDVAGVVAALGEDAVDVVGFSMGGFVLLALLERHPEVVRTATFVGTRANADDADARAGRDALARTVVEQGRSAGATAILPKLVGAGASEMVRARLRTMFEDQPSEGLVAALSALRERPDRLSVVAGAGCPVLVVAGESDELAPPELTLAVAQAAPDSHVALVSGAGHTTPLERPDEVARALLQLWGDAAGLSPALGSGAPQRSTQA